MIEGIKSLPPGHYLVRDEGGIKIQQFRDPLCAAAGSEFPATRNGDAEARIASQVREMVEGSVARHVLQRWWNS